MSAAESTDKSSATSSRKDERRRRWIVPAAIAAGALFVLLAPLWAPLFLRRMAFFRVRHVEVTGARYITPAEVLDRLRVDTTASVWDPFGPLEARVRRHPMVRRVSIDRRLPGTLVVHLLEHIPVALVPTASGFRAYDERGVALPIDPTRADVDAPILATPDRPLLRFLAAARVQNPTLYRRLSEVRRQGEGGGELLLMLDSVPVWTLAGVTLQRLSDLELVEQDLARRRRRAVELDLRYRDQVIARLP